MNQSLVFIRSSPPFRFHGNLRANNFTMSKIDEQTFIISPCYFLFWTGPDSCLQYFTADTGVISRWKNRIFTFFAIVLWIGIYSTTEYIPVHDIQYYVILHCIIFNRPVNIRFISGHFCFTMKCCSVLIASITQWHLKQLEQQVSLI